MIIDNYDKNSKDTQNKLFAFDVKVMKQLKKAGLWDWELEEKFWLKYCQGKISVTMQVLNISVGKILVRNIQ